jgi:hypothetical protein
MTFIFVVALFDVALLITMVRIITDLILFTVHHELLSGRPDTRVFFICETVVEFCYLSGSEENVLGLDKSRASTDPT